MIKKKRSWRKQWTPEHTVFLPQGSQMNVCYEVTCSAVCARSVWDDTSKSICRDGYQPHMKGGIDPVIYHYISQAELTPESQPDLLTFNCDQVDFKSHLKYWRAAIPVSPLAKLACNDKNYCNYTGILGRGYCISYFITTAQAHRWLMKCIHVTESNSVCLFLDACVPSKVTVFAIVRVIGERCWNAKINRNPKE